MKYKEVEQILEDSKYFDYFREKVLHRCFGSIDYGKKHGIHEFKGLLDASDKFTHINPIEESKCEKWTLTLRDSNSSDIELLLTCLEIFDWGGVLRGNVVPFIQLYRSSRLKNYLNWVSTKLDSKVPVEASKLPYNVLWSSGWTKVYSFINNEFAMYDSRVSAFLNYTLIGCDHQNNGLERLYTNLFNFGGTSQRERKMPKSTGFKDRHPSGVDGLNANLIASWIMDLINVKLGLKRDIRDFERAFFLLGFDLAQLELE
jgi:hypothetical protein